MEYPKVCLRRGEEGGVLKGQRLIYAVSYTHLTLPTN